MIINFCMRKKMKEPVREKKMTLRCTGESRYYVNGCATVNVEWASCDVDANGEPEKIRVPEETVTEYDVKAGFEAAGKKYQSIKELVADLDERNTKSQDVYGREVLYLTERFPCFDSWDYLYENRYCRWFFLKGGDTLTRVYYKDQDKKVFVTTDVQHVEEWCWKKMAEMEF